MGKVRELLDEWLTSLGGGYNVRLARVEQYVGDAERVDTAAHAAELDVKDRRIRELEAAIAKRELPPLPESVRAWVEHSRQVTMRPHSALAATIAWFDTHYPAPVPQWELDARLLELVPGVMNAPDSTREEVFAIAARIREAGRGNSK